MTPIWASSKLALRYSDSCLVVGKTKLRLKNPHLVQIHIDQGFFKFRQSQFGGLDAVPVGYINKVNLRHLKSPQ